MNEFNPFLTGIIAGAVYKLLTSFADETLESCINLVIVIIVIIIFSIMIEDPLCIGGFIVGFVGFFGLQVIIALSRKKD